MQLFSDFTKWRQRLVWFVEVADLEVEVDLKRQLLPMRVNSFAELEEIQFEFL